MLLNDCYFNTINKFVYIISVCIANLHKDGMEQIAGKMQICCSVLVMTYAVILEC